MLVLPLLPAVGHTLGLSHDGQGETLYYAGHRNWAPIMGMGYWQPLTQWSKGEYADATQLQDDVAILRRKLGGVAHDAGTSRQTARLMKPTDRIDADTALAVASGVVDDARAEQWYAFEATAATGVVSATAVVVPFMEYVRANLDLVLTLYHTDGQTILEQSNPWSTWDADDVSLGGSLVFDVHEPGVYYVTVKSTGSGDPYTWGYSAYGSLGQYNLTVTYHITGSDSPGRGLIGNNQSSSHGSSSNGAAAMGAGAAGASLIVSSDAQQPQSPAPPAAPRPSAPSPSPNMPSLPPAPPFLPPAPPRSVDAPPPPAAPSPPQQPAPADGKLCCWFYSFS